MTGSTTGSGMTSGTTGLTTDVLVVGAGPTGLMLANWLRKLGAGVVIVDAKAGPTRESRAVVLQARTMEILDQLGIVDTVLAEAEDVRSIEPGYGRKRFGVVPIGTLGAGTTPYPRLYVLEQSKTERILYDNLRALGADVLWNHALDDVTQQEVDGDTSVLATAVVEGEQVSISARFCVGADGSGSAVRRLLGIGFKGVTNEHTFFVCDADDVLGLRHESVNVRFGDEDFLLTFPLGGERHHRLIGTVPFTGSDVTESVARDRADRVYGVTWGESAWFATYRVHHRVASAFRQGPFFLAGDAGHVHSPVGAQGMNTGLQDAHNLAFKVVDVLRGGVPEASLDRYEAERRPVALRLISTTDRVFGFVTSSRRRDRMVRRRLAPLVAPVFIRILPSLPVASRLFQYLSQTRIHYWMSDDAKRRSGGRRDPVVGRRLPWNGENHASLRDCAWQVQGYGPLDPAVVAEVRRELGVPVHTFPPDRRAHLERSTFYLVRPDGFVAAKAAPGIAVSEFVRWIAER